MPFGQYSQGCVGCGSNHLLLVRLADQPTQLHSLVASLVFFPPSALSLGKPLSKWLGSILRDIMFPFSPIKPIPYCLVKILRVLCRVCLGEDLQSFKPHVRTLL